MSTDHTDHDYRSENEGYGDHPLTTAYERVHNAAHDMGALEQVEELKVKRKDTPDLLRHIKAMRRFWHQ